MTYSFPVKARLKIFQDREGYYVVRLRSEKGTRNGVQYRSRNESLVRRYEEQLNGG